MMWFALYAFEYTVHVNWMTSEQEMAMKIATIDSIDATKFKRYEATKHGSTRNMEYEEN